MNMQPDPKGFIERPDGSQIHYDKLDPAKQIEHDLVTRLCGNAISFSGDLKDFKTNAISELLASRAIMFEDYGVAKGGKEGNLTLRSVCGRLMVKMTVSKSVHFGPELEAAKALIFEFLEDELAKGGSQAIHEIVTKVFKLNSKDRVDTGGILGLAQHKFDDDRWKRAMEAIEDATIRDNPTTYVNFYKVNPNPEPGEQKETRIILDLAGV